MTIRALQRTNGRSGSGALIVGVCAGNSTRSSICGLAGGLVVLALTFFAGTSQAHADFRVCNGTQNLVGVAIGYRASEGWISEGWWQIPATTCATLIEGALQSRYYYLYAEDAAQGGRWAGEVDMCVADDEFKIVGVGDCLTRGYQRMPFKEYDTRRQGSWMVQLSDSPVGSAPIFDDGANGRSNGQPNGQGNGQ